MSDRARAPWLLAGRARIVAGVMTAALLLGGLPVLAQDEGARPLPPDTAVLEPGRYVTDVVGPRLSFELDEGWRWDPSLVGPIVVLEHRDLPGGVLSITRFDGDAYVEPCGPSFIFRVEPSPDRLIGIIGGNPWLHADPPEAIEVAGRDGLSLDVVTPPWEPEECRFSSLLIWALPMTDGDFVQIANQQARFLALDVGAEVLVIAIETFPGVPFGFFEEAAMKVVDSLRIGPD